MTDKKAAKQKVFSEWRLTLGVYACVILTIIFVVSLYRIKGHSDVVTFLGSRPGAISVGAALLFVAAAVAVLRICLHASRQGITKWRYVIVMHVAVILISIFIAEIFLRSVVHENKIGERLGSMLLYPRQWDRTVRAYQRLVQRAKSHPTYYVFDETLGFTVGKSRTSERGPYLSSVEGLRSGRAGESFERPSPGCRIALLGDSFTFGEVVPYEDTWGYRMQQRLGSQCQILNFGVGGYGVDQMYLRYLQDVRAWRPDLVILGFIDHDVIRTMAIYIFLMFPEGGMPFSKPRFVLKDHGLEVLNTPLPRIPEILARQSIHELPFIDYDVNYKETEWDRPIDRYVDASYVLRLFLSMYPLHERERPEISRIQTERINRIIFEKFTNDVKADHAVPILVYLPTETDFPRPRWEPIALKIVREAGLPYHDLRACVGSAGVSKLFNPAEVGGHYSPYGNQVVSDCLFREVPELRARLIPPVHQSLGAMQ
ncbi:hypothetical protein W02_40310 [Nitrospira sp. KM1]|uniref:SGNH/GDSL hydrolase family protein n=1 Tax=Nitrospira sp. KM1 TaxID=1936990 RepID=UPI0013A77A04|nr:SGNH/GDSL hydrolase family protein [Nitrospira sp. KM1]BCA56891.1 hypothetical protein W02_40310 [Nitrospira sp. KM1]